jgi:hypothetical protein
MAVLTLLFAWLLALALPAQAQQPGTDDPYTLSVLTFGAGDDIFSKFGHNAILVKDAQLGREEVYNFGAFDAKDPMLIPNFIKGRMEFWLMVRSLGVELVRYQRVNRSIQEQVLDLDPDEERAIVERLRHKAKRENRTYRYHYYLNNCSTRVRDVLDEALDGQLKQATSRPTENTWRDHTLRMTWGTWGWFGLGLVLSEEIDRPLTVWEEMFLPDVLRHEISTLEVTRPGVTPRPLVTSDQELLASTRDLSPVTQPSGWFLAICLGLVGGSFLAAGAYRLGAPNTGQATRALAAVLCSLVSLVAAVAGSLFAFLWTTDHTFCHGNENLLLLSPLWWAPTLLGLGAWAGSTRARDAWAKSLLLTAGLAALAPIVTWLPGINQVNGPFIVMFLLSWLGFAYGARRSMLEGS